MKTNDFKDKWKQFRTQKGYLQRLDPSHPMDFFIGINKKGFDEIVLFTTIEPALIRSSKALEIEKNKRSDGRWATQIASVEARNQDIFAKLCLDLVESSSNVLSERDGLDKVTRRFLAWQRLFESMHAGLAKHVLKGLVGEISFAKDVLSKHYLWDEIMDAWQGPDGADRDYIFPSGWYEIKSTATGKDKITISSLNQLETEDVGFLIKLDVDESSLTDPTAESVAAVIRSVREILQSYPSAAYKFEQKLVSLGYIDRQEYEEIFFTHKNYQYFSVGSDFPKLITASVPPEIVGAKYDISIAGIERFRKSEKEVWN